ncbi:hypothetical protein Gbth_044_015 [Gluconobacter thailandicus F149-1 = NBRC 100600]|uniref:hypothetical protein n=1 Tax=Gluconobacter thailandicus TaxID=257438 RepID=UPI00054E7B26|nr:hypothetical protein [Gluconobacter thailandicus]KXV53641.1 hypothetical protein AD946_07100 [Gluconobacter thailandicus]GAN94058.1 hypothetical protein Gbth_044_015 [Gluconobacter thailandicus F149-1 = NBRC 100600]GEL87639.1 hypothetical protein GTH01_19970 [Gluconobacter thailandicus F149-1 = NBRC 100600]
MSIFHTLKRKLRSCRRQQDAVLANRAVDLPSQFSTSIKYDEDFRKVLAQLEKISARQSVELEPWVVKALERMESIGGAERLWSSEVTDAEKEAFKKKIPEEQAIILNCLLRRVNTLRYFSNGPSKYVLSSPDITLNVTQQ